jgi:hypothetical protein
MSEFDEKQKRIQTLLAKQQLDALLLQRVGVSPGRRVVRHRM